MRLEKKHGIGDEGEERMMLKDMQARWAWGSDDPHELAGRLGMRVVRSTTITNPPKQIRDQLSVGYRVLLPALDKVLAGFGSLTLVQ